MFPNFTSLSQRERKRLDLLKQAERDIQNDKAKRQAYGEAMWASDVEKNRINLTASKTTLSTQTETESPQTRGKSTSVFSNINREDKRSLDKLSLGVRNPEGLRPRGSLDIGDANDSVSEFADDIEMDSVQGDDVFYDALTGEPFNMSLGRPRLGMIDDDEETKDDPMDSEVQGYYRDKIYEMFDRLPELSVRKYNPIDRDGEMMGDYYFGNNALLQHRRGATTTDDNNPMDRIDWRLTWSYIKTKDGRDLNRLLDPFDAIRANKREQTPEDHARKQLSMLVNDLVREKGNLAKQQLKKHFTPYDIEGKPIPGYRLAEYSSDIRLQKKKNAESIPDIDKKVSWALTTKHLLQSMDGEGAIPASKFITTDKPAARTTITDDLYIKRIHLIFETLPWLWSYGINPVVRTKTGKPQFTHNFHFGSNGSILDPSGSVASANAISTLYDRVLWGHSYSRLIEKLREIRNELVSRAPSNMSADDLKRKTQLTRILETHNDSVESIAPVKIEGMGLSKIQLRGRGLMGAGAKNLREIEGTGTASDLKYKRLGSKFIRVKDLRENRLKLVYPNRTPVGKLRDIDPKLSKLIDRLLFDKDIDQHLYGQLSIDDKKLFCEILKSTHLQHQFSNALEDPIESLRAEFDKLVGQVQLGNDNPDLIRELKTIAVDLYSQKLISDDDFKSIVLL